MKPAFKARLVHQQRLNSHACDDSVIKNGNKQWLQGQCQKVQGQGEGQGVDLQGHGHNFQGCGESFKLPQEETPTIETILLVFVF